MHPLEQHQEILGLLQKIEDKLALLNKYRFADQYIDTAELMELLKADRKTIQNWRDTGLLNYARLNKKIYYRLSDINAMFEKEFNKPKRLKKQPSPPLRKKLRKNPKVNGWKLRL